MDEERSPSKRTLSARQQAEVIASVSDPFARRSLRVAYHVRRYSVIYVVGALAIIAVGLLPTVGQGSDNVADAAGSDTGGAYAGTTSPASPGAVAPGAPGRTPGGTSAVTGPGGTTTTTAAVPGGTTTTGPVGTVQVAAGVTRGGYKCTKGVRQLPFSQYAAPCVAQFTGNNGGATWNGVTRSTITIGLRKTSDAQGANAKAIDAEAVAAGGVTPEVEEKDVRALIAWANKNFEFYGRQIKLVNYNGQGNGTDESLGSDQAAACADADKAATSVHAFAALRWGGLYEYGPFAACAKRYKLMVPFGALYYPESEYQHDDPYVWAITTSCTIGGSETAEFLGKQIAPYPAKWAGMDGALNMKNKERKFGNYVPTNAGYQECAKNTRDTLVHKYGMSPDRWDQYNYALDISQAGSDSNKAAIQFASNHDTSVILSTDPIAPIFLSQACHNQNYFPEWILTGVALTDQDNWAQLWDQQEMRGRLFGLSQLGAASVMQDPHGEAARVLKAAGVPLNAGSALIYYEMLPIFNYIQAAGPVLTPANVAAGIHSLPLAGGPTGADGTWYFGTTHTGIIDSREIYWNANKTSPANGKRGTYIAVYNGRRFRQGQYPTGQPPFFP
jgi:hypothetical protein